MLRTLVNRMECVILRRHAVEERREVSYQSPECEEVVRLSFENEFARRNRQACEPTNGRT